MKYIISRLSEAGTWSGIAAICTAIGTALSGANDTKSAAIAVVAGVAAVLIKERSDG
jgi:hypothetical protein